MEKEQTSISMKLDLGVDLRHMYEMIRYMHSELSDRQKKFDSMIEQLTQYENQCVALQQKLLQLESENRSLIENQETLLAHVWDVDVVWLEEWFLKGDMNIIRLFCSEDTHSNENRLGIVSRCGSWNNIVEMWETFARNCEEQVRDASSDELRVLDIALRLFNTSQRAKKASLVFPEIGDSCRSSVHTRLRGEGTEISSIILPGLCNVQGELKGKPLVCTL